MVVKQSETTGSANNTDGVLRQEREKSPHVTLVVLDQTALQHRDILLLKGSPSMMLFPGAAHRPALVRGEKRSR